MRFEKSLRRLVRRLPQQELPTHLDEPLRARLSELTVAVPAKPKAQHIMKPLLINALLFATIGIGITQYRAHQQPSGPHLHFVDSRGNAIRTGVHVTLDGPAPMTVTGDTNSNGDFYITDPGVREFSAKSSTGGLVASGKIEIPSNHEQVVLLSENKKNFVQGRLTDELGAPLGRQKVSLYKMIFLEHGTTGTEFSATTDDSGRFLFPLLPGSYYSISANVPGFAFVSIPPVIGADQLAKMICLKEGEVRDLGDITLLRADSFVEGTVVDETGRGVNARVSVDGKYTNADAYTKSSGHFRIENVVRGEKLNLVVRLGKNGYDDREHWLRSGVKAGDTGLKIVLRPADREKRLPVER